MYRILVLLFLVSFLNAKEAKDIYFNNACNSCHGVYGEGVGASPRLQGLNKDYIKRRLHNLKRGKTRTAFGSIMVSFAQSLSSKEIEEMAIYLSNLKKEVNIERYEIEYETVGDGGS